MTFYTSSHITVRIPVIFACVITLINSKVFKIEKFLLRSIFLFPRPVKFLLGREMPFLDISSVLNTMVLFILSTQVKFLSKIEIFEKAS